MRDIDIYSRKFINRFYDKFADKNKQSKDKNKQSNSLDKKQLPLFLKGAISSKTFIDDVYLKGYEKAIEDYREKHDEVRSTIGLNADYGILNSLVGHSSKKLYKALAHRLYLFLGSLPTSVGQEIIIPSSYTEISQIVIPKAPSEIALGIRMLMQQNIDNGVLDFTELKIRNFDLNNMVFKPSKDISQSNSDDKNLLLNMQKCVFNNVSFVKSTLDHIDMQDVQFYKVNFQDATLKNIVFKNADFTHINLDDCIMEDCDFENCVLNDMSIKSATLKRIKFTDCKITQKIDLHLADIEGLEFNNTRLHNVIVTEKQKNQFRLDVPPSNILSNKEYAKKLCRLIKNYAIEDSKVPEEIKRYVLENKLEDIVTLESFFENLKQDEAPKKVFLVRDNGCVRLYFEDSLYGHLNNGGGFHPTSKNDILLKHFMKLSDLVDINIEKIQT